MTRPGHVTVELPLEEAEGLLRRLDPDALRDYRSMTAAECDAAEAARKRIMQAIRTETNSGGTCERVVRLPFRGEVGDPEPAA